MGPLVSPTHYTCHELFTNARPLVPVQAVSGVAAAGVGAVSVDALMVALTYAQHTLIVIWSRKIIIILISCSHTQVIFGKLLLQLNPLMARL